MLLKRLLSPFIVFTCLLLVFSSCKKKEGCTDAAALNYDPAAEKNCCCEYAETFDFQMHMHAYVGAEVLEYGNTYSINGVNTRIDNARFYVSHVRLVDADGNETPAETQYALIDALSVEYDFGKMPVGNYTKVRFDVGLDSATNHSDPAQYPSSNPLSFQSPAMNWGWETGYMFMLIHGEVDTDADAVTDADLIYHLGTDDFLTPVEIDYPLDATTTDLVYITHLIVNWEDFFAGVDLTTDYHTETYNTLAQTLQANVPGMITKEE